MKVKVTGKGNKKGLVMPRNSPAKNNSSVERARVAMVGE